MRDVLYMLILAKTAMAMMLGFIFGIVVGYLIIPILKKMKFGQNVSHAVGQRHIKKNGTPTMGGLIFIIPTKRDSKIYTGIHLKEIITIQIII